MEDEDIRAIKRIVREEMWESIEIEKIRKFEKDNIPASGEVMVTVSSPDGGVTRNAFAGNALEPFLAEGYVATSVAAGDMSASAWFQPMNVGIDVDV